MSFQMELSSCFQEMRLLQALSRLQVQQYVAEYRIVSDSSAELLALELLLALRQDSLASGEKHQTAQA